MPCIHICVLQMQYLTCVRAALANAKVQWALLNGNLKLQLHCAPSCVRKKRYSPRALELRAPAPQYRGHSAIRDKLCMAFPAACQTNDTRCAFELRSPAPKRIWYTRKRQSTNALLQRSSEPIWYRDLRYTFVAEIVGADLQPISSVHICHRERRHRLATENVGT